MAGLALTAGALIAKNHDTTPKVSDEAVLQVAGEATPSTTEAPQFDSAAEATRMRERAVGQEVTWINAKVTIPGSVELHQAPGATSATTYSRAGVMLAPEVVRDGEGILWLCVTETSNDPAAANNLDVVCVGQTEWKNLTVLDPATEAAKPFNFADYTQEHGTISSLDAAGMANIQTATGEQSLAQFASTDQDIPHPVGALPVQG